MVHAELPPHFPEPRQACLKLRSDIFMEVGAFWERATSAFNRWSLALPPYLQGTYRSCLHQPQVVEIRQIFANERS